MKFLTANRKAGLRKGFQYHRELVESSRHHEAMAALVARRRPNSRFILTEKSFRQFARDWIVENKDREARIAAEVAERADNRAALIAEHGEHRANLITEIHSLDMANHWSADNRASRARLVEQLESRA